MGPLDSKTAQCRKYLSPKSKVRWGQWQMRCLCAEGLLLGVAVGGSKFNIPEIPLHHSLAVHIILRFCGLPNNSRSILGNVEQMQSVLKFWNWWQKIIIYDGGPLLAKAVCGKHITHPGDSSFSFVCSPHHYQACKKKRFLDLLNNSKTVFFFSAV